ncbi:retrovirus-related pol polyprotein from transposon TNT 1-94 [Tanacetum coccineum]
MTHHNPKGITIRCDHRNGFVETVSMGNTGVVGVVVTKVIGQVAAITLNPPIGNTGVAAVEEHEVVSMGNTSDESTADKGVIGSNVATTLNPPFCATMSKVDQVNALLQSFPFILCNEAKPTSLTKDNLRKLEANVLNDAYYDVWLPFASVHEFSSIEGVDSVLRNGPWMIRGILIFLNKWLPSVILLKEDLFLAPVWVDNMVMVVPNLEETRYMKETIRVEYECELPHCSKCLIFGHSLGDCLKAPKRVVNRMDKGKGGSSGVNDEGASLKTTPSVGKKNVSTPGNVFSLSNSFEALNVENPVIEEVETGNRLTSMLEGKCVFVNDDGKPLKNVDYSGNEGSEDEVESVDNEMASYLALKLLGLDMGIRACGNQ